MTSFATLTWLSARQLRGPALLSLALIATYAGIVTGPDRLADYYRYAGIYAYAPFALPILFGAGVAAPLPAREQQNGTVDLAYTQSAPRARWLAARILPTLVLAVATMLGVRAAFELPPGNHVLTSFDGGDVVVRISFVLVGCALGLCAGAVLGRTLPAMAATVAGYLVVWLGALQPIVPLFAPAPVVFSQEEVSRINTVNAVVHYVLAAVLLAVTFGWMTRRVPRR